MSGWLSHDDILVCDNATLHEKGYNTDLADFLWETTGKDGRPLNILLFPLPTRSPELKPIELIWHTLVMRMKAVDMPSRGGHAIAELGCDVLEGIDINLICRTYRHCGYKF